MTIEKVVKGKGGTFTFTATVKNGGLVLSGYGTAGAPVNGFVAGVQTFTLAPSDNGSATRVLTIPLGAVITVAEDASEGYTTSVGGSHMQSYTSGAITGNTTITFTNTEVRVAPTGVVAKTTGYWWLMSGGIALVSVTLVTAVIIRRRKREYAENV